MKRREQALEYLCVGGGRDGVGGGGMNGVGGESAELKAKIADMQRKMEQMSQMQQDKRQQEQVIFVFVCTQNILRQYESLSKHIQKSKFFFLSFLQHISGVSTNHMPLAAPLANVPSALQVCVCETYF